MYLNAEFYLVFWILMRPLSSMILATAPRFLNKHMIKMFKGYRPRIVQVVWIQICTIFKVYKKIRATILSKDHSTV